MPVSYKVTAAPITQRWIPKQHNGLLWLLCQICGAKKVSFVQCLSVWNEKGFSEDQSLLLCCIMNLLLVNIPSVWNVQAGWALKALFFIIIISCGIWEPYIRPLLYNTPWKLMNDANEEQKTKLLINSLKNLPDWNFKQLSEINSLRVFEGNYEPQRLDIHKTDLIILLWALEKYYSLFRDSLILW